MDIKEILLDKRFWEETYNKMIYNSSYNNLKDKFTYDAIGCSHCNNTGFYERIGIFEILLIELIITFLIDPNRISILIYFFLI